MSNPIREVTACEGCGQQIDLQSPPLREYYQNGRIDIKDGMVLLDRPANAQSHATSIEGYYCGLECFAKRIRKLRKRKA